MQMPSAARLMTTPERELVERVYGSTLPSRYRIILTDALGGGGAPFTIPTSLISAATIPGAFGAALDSLVLQIPGMSWFTSMRNATGSGFTDITNALRSVSQAAGIINLGYIMNVGAAYPDMMANDDTKELLVHETCHVWQGHNSWSSTTYVLNSITHQCSGMIKGQSRNAAYDYTPGQSFSTYNAEQQASIVEDWYVAGEPTSGDLWPYIQNNIRTGTG
ncbi:hypothetical protein [Vannielia sp. SX4]|uniref:hypothetical protein n=1 Tax=Vannielia sp. SX4 TaxID=3463852 RepID=UPI004058B001